MNRKLVMMTMGAGFCVLTSQFAAPVEAAQTCVWRGTAPACSGACEGGEKFITNRPESADLFLPPDGKIVNQYGKGCVTGSKALCCKAEAPNPDFVSFCNRYADDAVSQVRQATELGCKGWKPQDYAGPRWTPDRAAHLNWCIGNDGAYSKPTQEGGWRIRLLDNCKKHMAAAKPPVGVPPLPTPQPQPTQQTAKANDDVDIHEGPGGNFPVFQCGGQNCFMRARDTAPVLAFHQDGWYQLKLPAVPGGSGWVAADHLTVTP